MSYKIYSDGNLIYDINVESLLLINPVLIMEDSMAGSLEFTMPPTHSHYDSIERLKSIITVERDGREIWEGRVLEERIDFYKRKKVTCEGELAYLNDTTQPQGEFHDIDVRDFLTTLINVHNSKASSDKQFRVGIVTVMDPNDSLYRYTNRETTLTCIRDKLIDRLGGHLRVRKSGGMRYLDYLADSPRTCKQTIEFGKNLLDFSQNFDASDFVTAIIPLGAKLDESEFTALESRVTIEEVNDGRDYLYSSAAVFDYGWLEKTVIWDDVHEPDILKQKGMQYLASVQFEKLVLEISAVDLHNINPEIDDIDVLDEIRVISPPHGLNRLFPVKRRSIPLAKPSEEKITLGDNLMVRLSDESWKSTDRIIKEFEAIPTKQEFLEAARANATELIHNALNGHVVITDDADELLIMDTDDIETAQSVWRWNLNGLGYSAEGYDGNYNLAITMDGTILGDRIAAGTVSAAKLDVTYTAGVQQAIENAEAGAVSAANTYTNTQITNSASTITLAAKTYTDDRLSSYATKSELTVGINGVQSQVSSKVGQDEFSTLLRQSATDIQIAWNGISDYIKIANGGISIEDKDTGAWTFFGEDGLTFAKPNASSQIVGTIGANKILGVNGRISANGLSLALYSGMGYIAFGYTQPSLAMDKVYNSALCLVNPYGGSSSDTPYSEAGWHFGYDVYGHNYTMTDFVFKQTYNGTTYTGYTGSVTVGDKTLTFKSGILIRVQ